MDKLSCLCGFNKADSGDGSQVKISVKVKQRCCNSVDYNRSINITVQDPATLAQILKKIDLTLEEISVSSSDQDSPT